jgi:putative oxidoreductase
VGDLRVSDRRSGASTGQPLYVPLAVAVLAPVIVNILVFHALMAPSGLPLALFVAVLWAVIFVDVRPAFGGLFQSRSKAQA